MAKKVVLFASVGTQDLQVLVKKEGVQSQGQCLRLDLERFP